MSVGDVFLANAADRVPRWAPTSHAAVRPQRCPPWLAARHSSQRDVVSPAPAKPITPISRHNQPTAATLLLATNPITAVKSP
jgi:hypothetical protein